MIDTLTHLDLEYNNVTGTIPEELCNLTQLEYLSLKFNLLQGEIPDCFDQLEKLKYLNLRDNSLTGTLPLSPDFCKLDNMQVIVVDRNYLTGPIPDCFARWTNLHMLSLADNAFTGTLPADLPQLVNLSELYLDGNELEGDPIAVINQLKRLRLLYIENNQFVGNIDEHFCRELNHLKAVDISSNNFTSTSYGIPPHIMKLPKLKIVDFSQNHLRGDLPAEIPRNDVLRFLSVHQNKMTGGIPSALANLTALWHLDVSGNGFHGPLRKQLFEMPELLHLFLSENPGLHAGPIPAAVANMTQLREISLKNTNRTGPLPEFLDFADLFLLDLDHNAFTGTIPSNYGRLTRLRHLLLNRNDELVGTLPAFTETTNLGTVLLDKTGVKGDFSSICNLPTFTGDVEIAGDVIAVADCSDVDSGIQCDCCHCCYKGQETCSNPVVASLDWTWEYEFRRTARDFAINNSFLEPPSGP